MTPQKRAEKISLQRAAQAWCKPKTSNIEMDVKLAKEFALILESEIQAAINETWAEAAGLVEKYLYLQDKDNTNGPLRAVGREFRIKAQKLRSQVKK